MGGLKFSRVEGGEVWHEDVEMWKVDDLESGNNVGYFYLDLYPRDGKYGHACMMQLQPGCLDPHGNRQKSVVVMLTNFSKPTRFFGTSVERDFVEAPSQMLENWVWEEESLRLMSKHYKDGTALPKEMLDKLVASKNANAGGKSLRQIFLATFDQRLHTMNTAPDT